MRSSPHERRPPVTVDRILDAIQKMGPPQPNVAQVPPPELIAFFVRWVRGLRQWKQQTLASFAEVSLTMVERVERAEKVSDKCLDQIAVALGYPPGYFTAPRVPCEENITKFVDTWDNLVPVSVRQLCTHNGIRQLGNCDGLLIHRPGIGTDYDDLISELAEWLDLASFVVGCPGIAPTSQGRRRKLYTDILGCVRRLEQSGICRSSISSLSRKRAPRLIPALNEPDRQRPNHGCRWT